VTFLGLRVLPAEWGRGKCLLQGGCYEIEKIDVFKEKKKKKRKD
jgi:hypothetical protein